MSKSKPVKNIDYIINYYKIMEIPEDSTLEDIKKAYKKRSQEYHPDKFQTAGLEIKEKSEHKYRLIVEGYKILSNEKNKALYDSQLEIFKKKYPNSISDNGYAIIDLTRELIDLDFLLTDQDKYDGQENMEARIEQLAGHNDVTFNIIENAYKMNPNDEKIKESYLNVLAHKNAYLNLMETAAYQSIGVLNKKESNPMSVDGYLDYIESEVNHYKQELVKSVDLRLLSANEQPLLIGMDQQPLSSDLSDIHAIVSEKITENFDKNKERLLKIAKEKQELLSSYVKMRKYKKVFENNESKNFEVILYSSVDGRIMGVFSLKNIENDDWEPVELLDNYPFQNISEIEKLTKTTYLLENNPELKTVLFIMEFVNDVVNGNLND